MPLPTPLYNLENFPDVYEPREDSFLFIDTLDDEFNLIKSLNPTRVLEVGSGSGVIITYLALTLGSGCEFYSSDINPSACTATVRTANLNNVKVNAINTDLFNGFKDSLFDVILFNPPYVLTEDCEIQPGLNQAWAGGKDGRLIINKFLLKLQQFLTKSGVCYMITIKENKIQDISDYMLKFSFKTDIVKERRVLGEHLYVLRFSRILIS